MENCLVTKLKAVVDNDNLIPLGGFKITAAKFAFNFNKECKVKIISDNTFTDGSKEMTASNRIDESVLTKSKATIFIFFDKTAITSINYDNNPNYPCELNLDDINYLTSLSYFACFGAAGDNSHRNTINGDFYKFLNSCGNITNLIVSNGNYANMDSIIKVLTTYNTKLTSINISNLLFGTSVDIADFANCVGCTSWNWWNDYIVGSIEDFVRKSRELGRTTGDIGIIMHNVRKGVTFKGVPATGGNNSTPLKLIWTENSITYNGETVQE